MKKKKLIKKIKEYRKTNKQFPIMDAWDEGIKCACDLILDMIEEYEKDKKE